jgi:hypothetical protein
MARVNTIQIKFKLMNVIIIRRDGLMDDAPILVKNDTTAEVVFESLVKQFTGDDYQYFGDESTTRANNLLEPLGVQIDWFTDIEINNYTNK